LIRGYCIATVPDIRMSRDHRHRAGLLGASAETPGAPRAGWETARGAFQGGAMTLTALDRCDRCGARAQHVGPHGLLFCGHHARAFGLTDPPTHEHRHDAHLSAPCRDE